MGTLKELLIRISRYKLIISLSKICHVTKFLAVVCLGDRWHKCEHNLHHVSRGSQEDARHQAALPRHDRQEHEEVLHLRGPGPGRQERAAEVPREQLPGQRNFSAILQYLFAENV